MAGFFDLFSPSVGGGIAPSSGAGGGTAQGSGTTVTVGGFNPPARTQDVALYAVAAAGAVVLWLLLRRK